MSFFPDYLGGGFSAAFINLTLTGNLSFGAVAVQTLTFGDNDRLVFGAGNDATIAWNTTQTVDGLYLGLATGQNTLIIAEDGDRAYDFANGAQTHPTIFLQSANQTATEKLRLNYANLAFLGAGLAATATEYEIGRNADATNRLFFNVPTGASYEWSVNDVALIVSTATSPLTITQVAGTSDAPTALTLTGAAHTGLTAATEDIGVNFNFSATKTWAAGAGPLATQREFVLQAPTYVGNAAGALTQTDSYTLYVTGPPTAGANMTITRPWAAGFNGNIGIGAGTVALPSLSFIDDPDTGIYNTANAIRFGTAGAARVVINSSGISVDTYNALAAATVTLRGTIADGATAIGVRFGNTNALVTAGAKIASFYSDNVTTERAYVNYLGSFNAGPGTVLLPAYSFAADPNTGFYNTAGNILSSIDGVLALTLNATAGTTHVYRNSERQGTDIASASTITLAADGNTFELTGVTAVNLITSTNWQDGSKITLIANENVTINHATATAGANITILLSAAGNFAMTANDTLTLVLSTTTAGGQAWREISRTVI